MAHMGDWSHTTPILEARLDLRRNIRHGLSGPVFLTQHSFVPDGLVADHFCLSTVGQEPARRAE